jgi:hypothetical protein
VSLRQIRPDAVACIVGGCTLGEISDASVPVDAIDNAEFTCTRGVAEIQSTLEFPLAHRTNPPPLKHANIAPNPSQGLEREPAPFAWKVAAVQFFPGPHT